jgi:hypothetical protein
MLKTKRGHRRDADRFGAAPKVAIMKHILLLACGFVLAGVVGPATAQDNEAERRFRDMQKKLEAANAIQFDGELDGELERIRAEQKSRWAWIAWILTAAGALAVLILIQGIRMWVGQEKRIKGIQDEEKRTQSQADRPFFQR